MTDLSVPRPMISARKDVAEALRILPPRRPADASPRRSEAQWQLIDLDTYEVRVDDEVVGYIDVVGAVFVVLAGTRRDRAEEIRQTLDFDAAVRALTIARAKGA